MDIYHQHWDHCCAWWPHQTAGVRQYTPVRRWPELRPRMGWARLVQVVWPNQRPCAARPEVVTAPPTRG